ncbi:MAG: histidinol dehydrogenase [Candidatus Gastranaerophilales bacterium]|nr:histidinol dehydrogenase [Candidatus Gastranaerophilales bacterium]
MQIVSYSELPAEFFEFKLFNKLPSVHAIIEDVKKRKDEALIDYSRQFGDGDIKNIELTQAEIDAAFKKVHDNTICAIKIAIENVKRFAHTQRASIKEVELFSNGGTLGQKIIPLRITGAYVPGGNYPLPSSAIMSVVPAKVAGVQEVVVCSPKIQDVTVVAASLAGADRIFRVGGVQAIAAMAYGTETIPKVDKITGPGNKFVTMAKKLVYGDCGIDFLAGPSEVLIIADDSAKPDFIAADMLAQCEHDADASAILITNSELLAYRVSDKINEFLPKLKTGKIAQAALENSYIIMVDDLSMAVEIANRKAPEHLELIVKNEGDYIDKLTNYGSLFIGNYSLEALGDYCSGTNHILPTNGVARYSAGLSVFDFLKIQTWQKFTGSSSSRDITKVASHLAHIEGLSAHKMACDIRLDL